MTVVSGRHRRPASAAWAGGAVLLVWSAVTLAAPRLRPSGTVHGVALFVHLGSVLVGFGAVLLVDWFGLLWVFRRRSLADVLRTAQGAHVPTWLGFAGLLASGVFLGQPSPVKMAAVLVVGLNGVYGGALLPRLAAHPVRALMARAVLVSLVSQAGWWTAVILGFLKAQS